jgi:hypothetical protein
MAESHGLGLLLSCFATMMTAEQAAALNRGLSSRGWPTARGRVLDETILTMRWQFGWAHSPAVLYEYEVEGEVFRAHTVSYHGSIFRRGAQATLDRYRPGQPVVVYYHPRNPQRAVLEPGSSFGAFLRVLFSVGVLGLGLWLYYSAA